MPRQRAAKATVKSKTVKKAANPLLLPRWPAPFGMAPFERIEPGHFAPAFKAALKQHSLEIAAIAENPARASFANTIKALEDGGRALTRVAAVFFNLAGAHTNAALQAIERDIAPVLSEHESAIYLNARLYARVADLWRRRAELKLNAEDARMLDRTHTAFVRAGAKLDAKAKKRVAAINARLAGLTTAFSQNVLADEQSWHLLLKTPADLEGLPEAVLSAGARTAAALGHPGLHAITLARSSVESFLQFSARRDLREEAYKAWIVRGENGGATDNRGIAAEIVSLRAELAQIMGYASYASYALDDTMAKTPETARGLLTKVWPAAVEQALQERAALQARAELGGENFKIEAWDWRYYAEKERLARFDLDDGELRPYFELGRMIDAAFDTASRLFGLSFRELGDVPRYHPDVRVWEVLAKDGSHVGVFMGDYFARSSKRSGAWMSRSTNSKAARGPSSST